MAFSNIVKMFDEKNQHPVNIDLKKTFHKRLLYIGFKFIFIDLVLIAIAICLYILLAKQFGGESASTVFDDVSIDKLNEHDNFYATFFAVEHLAFIVFLFAGLVNFGVTILLLIFASIAFIYRRWIKQSSVIHDANNGTTTGTSFHEEKK